MPFVTDSTQAGYLGPSATPSPLDAEAWTNFLHDIVAGVTGLDPTLVRPRWQQDPPNQPDIGVDWAAVGITDTSAEGLEPIIIHRGAADAGGDGHDELIRVEVATLLCSFYGPNAQTYAGYLRDGLYIDQNRAALRANDVGLIEVMGFTHTADLFRERFRDRVDVNVIFRRAVHRRYEVRNLLVAVGTITANAPPADRTVEDSFDTSNEE